MNDQELTPRQKEVARLQKEISKAVNAKHFVESEEGKHVIGYISELISSFTNQIIGKRKTHEEYIELRAQIDILRRLKQVLENQGAEKVLAELQDRMDLATSEE